MYNVLSFNNIKVWSKYATVFKHGVENGMQNFNIETAEEIRVVVEH